jgi:hypothetical protein
MATVQPDTTNDIGAGEDRRRYDDVASKFLLFARNRAVGSDKARAMAEGRFAATPGAAGPDLFGVLDMAYAGWITGALDTMLDGRSPASWIELILSFQDGDGWFRARDRQAHGVVHATAYALGALRVLGSEQPRLKTMSGFQALRAAAPDVDAAPFALSALERVHFWRGSHRAGGMAAIVAMVRDLGLSSDAILGISDPQAWLDGWWRYFNARIDPRTGLWRLSHPIVQTGFDLLYRSRHNPRLAAMGGAVHLYWVSEHLGKPMRHPAEIISGTAALLPADGLYERAPYCIDLDANFMIARSLRRLDAGHPAGPAGLAALRRNRDAVLAWFNDRQPDAWSASSHKLPGAFAAVAEADIALTGRSPWRDVFERSCWL